MRLVEHIFSRVRVSLKKACPRKPSTDAPRPLPSRLTAAVVVLALALAACSVNGAGDSGFSGEKNLGEGMAERSGHEPRRVPALRAGGNCRNKETLFAHVDDDKLRDRVYHDRNRRRPVLGVCTGDGRIDQRPGAGMTELLRIIDVQRDGRDEILYGATLISSKNFYVAVFRKGQLRRVLRPKGKPLLLIKGAYVNPDRGKAFGCRKSAEGNKRKLVKASVRKTSHRRFRWTRAIFRLRDASAKRTSVEKGRTRHRGRAYEVAAALVKPC